LFLRRRGREAEVSWWRKEAVNLGHREPELPAEREWLPDEARPITLERVKETLRRLQIRFLTDDEGYLLALWEGHSVLFGVEGEEDNVLVMRARADALVPQEWAVRAYTAVNEWNRTRRFLKAFIGTPADSGSLPVYGEMQVYLGTGVHDALLDDLVDCVTSVAGAWMEWLSDEGGLI
jgi:hypothetical protein